MKILRQAAALIALSLFIMIAPVGVFAQERTAVLDAPQLNASNCSQEAFEKAETSFRMRRGGSEMLGRAERELKSIVQSCADLPWHYQAKEYLKVTQEDLANQHLAIALFYQKRFDEGRSKNLNGVRSRFKMIVERYPQYSQTDKVLLLLGGVNVSEGNPDEAARYYQRIINEFPASQYVGEAYHRLAAIEGVNNRVSPKP